MKTIIAVPTINVNDEVVVLVRWHVPDGTHVDAGAPLVDVETTKAIATVQGDHSGWLKHCRKEGDEVPVGAEVAWVFSSAEELANACSTSNPPCEQPGPHPAIASPGLELRATSKPEPINICSQHPFTRLSGAARKLAASLGVDPARLEEAKLGLVTSAGLRAFLELPAASPGDGGLRSERITLSKRAEIDALRAGAGEHLRSSLSINFDSAGMRAFAEGAGYGLLPLILAELGSLLAENPRFTAYYDRDQVIYYDAVNLGVAIDIGHGLKIAVLRNADRMDPDEISKQLAERTLDCIENKLAIENASGGTFTVTDLSMFDILHFQPLINGRQSAILGIGADAAQMGYPMSLTIAFDHRVLTGREVGSFLQVLRDRLLRYAEVDASGPPAHVCDMCLTDLASYYKEFGKERSAVMTQYMRPDGKVGLICHRCLMGYL